MLDYVNLCTSNSLEDELISKFYPMSVTVIHVVSMHIVITCSDNLRNRSSVEKFHILLKTMAEQKPNLLYKHFRQWLLFY